MARDANTAVVQLDFVAADRTHIGALNRFVCASPEKAAYDGHRHHIHPRPWEIVVQSWFRNLSPPVKTSEVALLGMDESGQIASACHFGFDNSGLHFVIFAIATSVEAQRNGCAAELLAISMDVISDSRRTLKMDGDLVTRIHPGNIASQKLFSNAGFVQLESGELELWGYEFPPVPPSV